MTESSTGNCYIHKDHFNDIALIKILCAILYCCGNKQKLDYYNFLDLKKTRLL